MSALVVLTADGDLRVSSLVVAERVGIQHKNVLELIRSNLADFETFGRVAFETAPFETAGGVQRREVAHLNEQQATLLVTFMRNSDVVREFKVELVKQFYIMRQELARPAAPQSFAEALELAAAKVRELEAAEAKIAADAPKVLFADAVAASGDSILVARLANVLKQNGRDIGQNRLFQLLREDGYLGTRGDAYNRPTQKAMDLGLFEVIERTMQHSDGSPRLTFTPKVTGKGQAYFVNRYAPKREIQAVAS